MQAEKPRGSHVRKLTARLDVGASEEAMLAYQHYRQIFYLTIYFIFQRLWARIKDEGSCIVQ